MKKSEKSLLGAVLILVVVFLVGLLSYFPSTKLAGQLKLADSTEEVVDFSPSLTVSGLEIDNLDSFNVRIDNVKSKDWVMVLRGQAQDDWLSGIYASTGNEEAVMNDAGNFTVYPFEEKGGMYFFDDRMQLPVGEYSLELWVDREMVSNSKLEVLN